MYDVVIVGAGPGGIFTAYELLEKRPDLKIAVFEMGNELTKRHCPIDGDKVKSCIHCKNCSIMSGFGGAGAFSDGKYNITNDFGGTLYEYIGKKSALELMEYVDKINLAFGGEGTKLYSTAGSSLKTRCMQNGLHLLDASVRHLGTDINYIVLEHLYDHLKEKIDFHFNCFIDKVEKLDSGYRIYHEDSYYDGKECVISAGRSGSKWMENVCRDLDINTNSNRVDIGVRVELPAGIFAHLTDELYESKIVYRTSKYEDLVRTFCMNPKGEVVNENTNGIVTVNGHSYEDPAKQTNNTNFALLVAKHFSEPFKDSNGYGESIARLSNMLGGGVIVQRFGDLIKGRRSTEERIGESFTVPTLNAAAGDLSLVLPKRLLDGIIEMIYIEDDEAIVIMVDANIQREELLPSEKAFAYKMKLGAMKRQAGRPPKNNSCQSGTNLRSDEELGNQVGESARSIQRYIRLTELIPDLLDYVDKKRLQFTVAVDISYIDKEIQTWLFEYIKENGTVKAVQVAALRTALEAGPMTQAKMISILVNSQPGRKQEQKITLSEKKLRNFFSDKYTTEDMESVILELLDQWKRGEITV